jgi:hypothetical protein
MDSQTSVNSSKSKKIKKVSKQQGHLQLLYLSHQEEKVSSPTLKSNVTLEEQIIFEKLLKKTTLLKSSEKKEANSNDIKQLNDAIKSINDTESLISCL